MEPISSGTDSNTGAFKLEEGARIVIPDNCVRHKCYNWNRRAFPGTSTLIRLERLGNGLFSFLTHERRQEVKSSFVLFVPDKVKEGSQVVISWVDPKCACASLEE